MMPRGAPGQPAPPDGAGPLPYDGPTVLQRFNRPVFVILLIGVVAGVIRFTALTRPADLVFDEKYYAKDACLYTGRSLKECRVTESDEKYWVEERDEVGSWVHPPLGKWLISLGIDRYGMNALGWRVSAAVVGTISVMCTAIIAWLLFSSTLWTLISGLLLATEGLHVVQSRIALLDIFVCFWVVLGFLFLLLDRRFKERHPNKLFRPWLMVCGMAFGAATATKWSGVTAMLGAALLAIGWEFTRLRKLDADRQRRSDLPALLGNLFGAFLLIPVFVYVVSFARFWAIHSFDLRAWFELHRAAADFHLELTRFKMQDGESGRFVLEEGHKVLTHPYASVPWSWPLLLRPVTYAFDSPGTHLLTLGNPVVFWGSIVAIPAAVIAWIRKRDWVAGFIAVAVLTQYLPWFLRAGRVQFLFYLTPVVPFMVLALVYGLRWMAQYRPQGARAHPFAPLAAALVVTSIAMFIFFYPVLTDFPMSRTAWQVRMWLPTWT